MTVIAMTREMGTRGKDVAAALAARLGIEVIHHELVERQLAERLNMSESAVHRFLEGESSLWERWSIDPNRLSRFSSEEVLELAKRGNVLIRGWGAAQLLRDVTHVMCVRICAPMADRVVEMQRRLGIDDEATVRTEIERNDEAHERAVRRQFRTDWRDATNYDVVINTGFVPLDTAVDMLATLVKTDAYSETDQSHTRLTDKLVAARVKTLLDAHLANSPIGSGLEVAVENGNVSIRGVVSSKPEYRSQLAAIGNIEGVRSVNDETVSLPVSFGV